MKRKASVSHDEAVIRRIRKDPAFAAEYLKSALEAEDEPRVPLAALRHLAQAQGIAKVARPPASNAKVSTGPSPSTATLASPHTDRLASSVRRAANVSPTNKPTPAQQPRLA